MNRMLGCAAMTWLLALGSCAPAPAPRTPPAPPVPGAASPRPAPSPAPASEGDSRVTIGLAWDLDSVVVTPVASARLTIQRRGQVRHEQRVSGALRVTVAGGDGRVRGEGVQLDLEPRDTLAIEGDEGPPDGPARFVRWDGKSWRGQFRVYLNPRGKLTLATRLALETYLLGVIPGEIGALAPDLLEAGRAQAIAARSYTLFYRGRRTEEGFDLFGTVEDQVYGPVESERPLATRCVTSTSGTIASSQGIPIRANYSSTCGGITSEVWEAWPTPPLPYLISHLDRTGATDFCASSPHYRWREEWSAAEFTANLARFGPPQGVRLPAEGVGELVDVRPLSRSRSGRVWRLLVTTTHGEMLIPAYSLRQVLRRAGRPESILRSNLIKLDVRRDPRTRRALAVVASGAGSGHGVGLCQTGALGMARNGARGEDILRHYYPGVWIGRTDLSRK
jgi:stage II sporulation protein D (peptidoglycan lytic transglycosylase)